MSEILENTAFRSGSCHEYIDLSTLSDTLSGARNLAGRADERNRMAIRRREAQPFARVARVRIEEVV